MNLNIQQSAAAAADYARYYNVEIPPRVLCEALNCPNEAELRHPLCKTSRFCSTACMNTIGLPMATPPPCCEAPNCRKYATFCSSVCANKVSHPTRGKKRAARAAGSSGYGTDGGQSSARKRRTDPAAMAANAGDGTNIPQDQANSAGTLAADGGTGAAGGASDAKNKVVYLSEAYIRAAEKKKAVRRERRAAKLEAALREAEAAGDKVTGDVSIDVRFNEDMDDALRKAVALYGIEKRGCWVKIASYVGRGVDNMACLNRWKYYIDPALESCKSGPWSAEELETLRELVPQHMNPGARNGKDTVDWTAVSKALNRSYKVTKGKWKNLELAEARKTMKRGPWSAEEDALIMQRRQEWELNGRQRGKLWPLLEKELNRRSEQVHSRWRELETAVNGGVGRNG